MRVLRAGRRSRPGPRQPLLQRPEQRRVRLDPVRGLGDGRGAGQVPVIGHRQLEVDRVGDAAELQVTVHQQATGPVFTGDAGRAKCDRGAPQDLSVDRLGDPGLIVVVERAHPTAAVHHLQRARVGGQRDRAIGRVAAELQGCLPAPHQDAEVVGRAGCRATLAGRHGQRAVGGSQRVSAWRGHQSRYTVWASRPPSTPGGS